MQGARACGSRERSDAAGEVHDSAETAPGRNPGFCSSPQACRDAGDGGDDQYDRDQASAKLANPNPNPVVQVEAAVAGLAEAEVPIKRLLLLVDLARQGVPAGAPIPLERWHQVLRDLSLN